MADEVKRSINIFLNEAELSASLEKLEAKSKKVQDSMQKIGDKGSAEFKKLNEQLLSTNAKIDQVSGQMSGKFNSSMSQMEATIRKAKNELKTFVGTQDEMVKKAKEVGKLESEYKKLQDKLEGVKKAAAENTSVFSGFGDKIKGMASTLPGIGQAFSAMLGPVGLVVGAIAGLISILTQNAEVADELAFAMSGIKNVVRTLADMLTGLIKNGFEKLQSAINNPKQALKDFGEALQQNVINRFKAFGVFLEAARLALAGDFVAASKKAGDALIQLGTGVEDGTKKLGEFGAAMGAAYQRGSDSERMLDAMTKAQAELNNAISRTNIAIEEQTTIMKDANKTDEARLAAADKVIELETRNANRRIQIIALEQAALKKKQDQLSLSGEEEAHLIDLTTQMLQAQADKVAAIRKATILRNDLEMKLAQQSMRDLVGETFTEVSAIAKKIDNEFTKVATVSVPKIYNGIWKQMKALSDWIKSDFGQAFNAGIAAVNSIVNSAMQISENISQKKLSQLGRFYDKQEAKIKEQFELGIISERVYNQKIEALQKEKARKEAQLKKDAFIKQKAANIAMAVINTASSIINALASAPWPVSLVMAALAGATGAAQIGVIASQPVPEFEKGGRLAGPRHSEGGIPVAISGRVVAEAEGDEWIINRNSSQKYNGILSAINKDDGSVQWLKGFPNVNMPFAIAGGALQMDENGPISAVKSTSESLKKQVAHGNKLQVESAKYIVQGIAAALAETSYKRRKL